jgi:hypothetical protein
MSAFLEWFEVGSKIDVVLKAAEAHLWFVTIHPFDDATTGPGGNAWRKSSFDGSRSAILGRRPNQREHSIARPEDSACF